MRSQGNGQPVRYEVRLSQQTKALLKQQHREAAEAGKGKEFLASLRHIIDRLRRDPLEFGDPLYRLPALKLLVCQAIVRPIAVDFAVHEEQPLVFIRRFRFLS
jgi:hypothetical protein